ncbi:hypothetical protein N7474_010238 [Penicillium riverlandense]|uniref:uncharacterized protein n=1 Tax=Penicillium riverlandense TaxID=1903569 RepID=UPI002548FD99|nr:uncharacterized protein N7474_010238 [Penicillium riverlandense]KAJ5808969.1 hypothetical protein N7474_010238 [Penicillium riverlandense]
MAALECWRQGHEVRIIEKSSSRLLSGDGFTIGSTAIHALRHWPDIVEENERIARHPWVSWHRITGEKISGPAPFYDPAEKKDDTQTDGEEAPRTIYRYSRPKFHKMLADQAEKLGIFVEYGTRVVEYYEEPIADNAGVVLENEMKIEADVVFAADGIGSKSSSAIMGHMVPARSTGFAIYRAAFPVELADADPMVRHRFKPLNDGTPVVEVWMGEGIRATFGRSEDEMSWTINYSDDGEASESWSNLVDPEIVLQKTANIPGWPEVGNRLIQLTPKERLHDFKLMWREPQPCWVSPGGRVIQIGDAAHSFLPSSGNGATQGMEDAISLATCLRLAQKNDLCWATRVHNKLRFERVSCLQLLGILNQETRHLSAHAKASTAHTKPIGLMAAWIWRHNPERYAIENYEAARTHLEDGKPFQNSNIPPGHVYQPWTIDEMLRVIAAGELHLDGDWE